MNIRYELSSFRELDIYSELIEFYKRKNDNGIKDELKQKIKENWKEYNYEDRDINGLNFFYYSIR